MKPELQQKLYDKYPKIFRQKDLPMTETCMGWGIECGEGWYWLLDNLCYSIQNYIDNNNENIRFRNKLNGVEKEKEWQAEAIQVKEKYGSLRFYISGGDDYIHGMIQLAEDMSSKVCEECGSVKDVKQTKGWIKSLCSECMLILKKRT